MADEREIVEALRKRKLAVSLGEETLDSDVTEWISTQVATLDRAIGRPGIPVGRLTNIYGEEASGKTTLGLHLLAETQRIGGFAILIDSEGRYHREWGERIGVNHDRLIVLRPVTLEETLEEINGVIEEIRNRTLKAPVLIVWDSLAASIPKARLDAGFGDAVVANYGRIMSLELPRIKYQISNQRIALVIINQLRAKLEIGSWSFKPSFTQVANYSLRYYSSLRIFCRSLRKIGDAECPEGMEMEARIEKNDMAPPWRRATYIIRFDRGIDVVQSALTVAVDLGLVEQRGGWYRYGGKAFRADDFGEILKADAELQKAIREASLQWMEKKPSQNSEERT